MKLIEMKCKECGGILQIEENCTKIKCRYCLSEYVLDDEVKKLKLEDMEKSGYDFEMGKIKAQEEIEKRRLELEQKRKQEELRKQKERKNKIGKVIIIISILILIIVIIYIIYLFNEVYG